MFKYFEKSFTQKSVLAILTVYLEGKHSRNSEKWCKDLTSIFPNLLEKEEVEKALNEMFTKNSQRSSVLSKPLSNTLSRIGSENIPKGSKFSSSIITNGGSPRKLLK